MTRHVALLVGVTLFTACIDCYNVSPPRPTGLHHRRRRSCSRFRPKSGSPLYAIPGNGGFIPNNGIWAAIPFHRDLTCVPPAANLLDLAIPAAFGCTLMVEGHEHWEHGPGIDLAPRQTETSGLGAVPIVFAYWNAVQGAVADGTLTLPELLALPGSIVGTADAYQDGRLRHFRSARRRARHVQDQCAREPQ